MDGTRRVTLREASEGLGVSVEAVRKRVKRKSLRSDTGPDGRVYVYLDAGVDASAPSRPEGGGDALADELRDRIRYLERQVEEEREARRRADIMLTRLMDRLPELEAPQERPGAPQTGGEGPEGAPPRSSAPGPQEAPQPRSWWRRWFGP